MVELHGNAPYKTVLIHGGPGAIDSLNSCAEELNRLTGKGIVEALQSKYSIAELIEELHMQITEHCQDRLTLIGHSWGAWLAVLFAGKYPKICKNIVLVGCPPLADQYVKEISLRRLRSLSGEERKIFQRVIDKNIQSKLFLVQGVCDPHPIEGVMKPLKENGIPCKTYILEKCGHNPFMEKYAKEEFYDILQAII